MTSAVAVMKVSQTYKKVLAHRQQCSKWGKEFCLNCFGGGLTKFVGDMDEEYNRFGRSLRQKSKQLNSGGKNK